MTQYPEKMNALRELGRGLQSSTDLRVEAGPANRPPSRLLSDRQSDIGLERVFKVEQLRPAAVRDRVLSGLDAMRKSLEAEGQGGDFEAGVAPVRSEA